MARACCSGGGQLGRMFCMAAQSLGYRSPSLDPGARQPGRQRRRPPHRTPTTSTRPAWPSSPRSRRRRPPSSRTSRPQALEFLARTRARVARRPPASRSRRTASARRRSSPTTASPSRPTRCCASEADARERRRRRCVPGIVKSARLGYDGKGQIRVRAAPTSRAGVRRAWAACPACSSASSTSRCEVSVIVARDAARRRRRPGRSPRTAIATASSTSRSSRRACRDALADEARDVATRGRGERSTTAACCASRCSSPRDGRLLVNEIAPRPHNSGHYTIDACVTSQFEQQARVLAGLPLGDTRQHEPAVMVNLLGDLWFDDAARGAARARLDARAARTRRRSCTSTARPSRAAAARWATSPASRRRSARRSPSRARSSAISASPAPTDLSGAGAAMTMSADAAAPLAGHPRARPDAAPARPGLHALPRRPRRRRRQGRGHRRRRLRAHLGTQPATVSRVLPRGEPQQAQRRARPQGRARPRGVPRPARSAPTSSSRASGPAS